MTDHYLAVGSNETKWELIHPEILCHRSSQMISVFLLFFSLI